MALERLHATEPNDFQPSPSIEGDFRWLENILGRKSRIVTEAASEDAL